MATKPRRGARGLSGRAIKKIFFLPLPLRFLGDIKIQISTFLKKIMKNP